MYGLEHSKQKIASKRKFISRVKTAIFFNILILVSWLFAGILGYHYLGNLSWIDSFLNASMILGGMGPVDVMATDISKLFSGFYAIFSGVVFLASMAVIAAPIIHRFLHRFHLDIEESKKN